MYSQPETNPHFQPHFLQLPDQRPGRPPRTPAHLHGQNVAPTPILTDPRISSASDTPGPGLDVPPVPPQPRPILKSKARSHDKRGGESPEPRVHFGEIGSHPQEQQGGQNTNVGQQGLPQQRPSFLRVTTGRKTKPIAWLIAAFCALFWIIVIVGGLAVLIIYLVYRPRLPKFDISTATLNAAYLDMGYLLNADLTLLGNFTNPNKKVNVDFSFVIMDLYYEDNLIATRYVEPFTALKRESIFQTVHMITSQVRLPFSLSEDLTRQVSEGRVTFDVRGLFRARSDLGGLLKFSYWLYSHCTITVTGPPIGALVGKKCTTKR